ncbi:MAG: 16S rRNA (guanine(527)-N(7))-methyltransferase RsmG [Capnocytophaga sp.]|uniref:16S rRNA (guanine(527)-N(7))-methyltransferase RsmG n=1 Tax=Capnocytophaga sp. TaxID=44737 RepID=UPI003FA063F8
MEIILKYYPSLSERQIEQFSMLKSLYEEWNAQINVISRKDMDDFYERHVLHSLAIGKYIQFSDDTQLLDVGTGGGFPGVPLAILFPNCQFTLVDSIGKKIKVVKEVVNALELTNVSALQTRAEELKGSYDFVVSRAVTQMKDFVPWVRKKFNKTQRNLIPNGILYLKGGDLSEELAYFPKAVITNISKYFEEPFFETKKIVYLPL